MRTCSTPIASPSCSAAKRPRARRLKAPRASDGRLGRRGSAKKGKGREARVPRRGTLPQRGGVFSYTRVDRCGFAEVLSPDARADPHGFVGMLSREPWRNRGGVPISCRRRPSWGGNGRWRLSAGGTRGRRGPVARVPFDCLSLARSANGAEAFPQMTGDACHRPSSRVPCACGCLLRGCLHVAGGLSGRQWKGIGGLMFLAGCPDSRGLVRCDLLLARAERRRRCP